MKRVALMAVLLAGCAAVDRPDESGLTNAEKAELVERYYACAHEGDAVCVQATLHPEFRSVEGQAFVPRGPHAAQFTELLTRNRLDARVLPHKGRELWAVELWTSPHGQNRSYVRSFLFEDRLIREKSAIES